jgi:plastin-1
MASRLQTSDKVTKVTTTGGIGQHSYTQDETEAFADHINTVLQDDKHLKHLLPLKDPKDLFEATKDGVLLCKLINSSRKGTIDERVINTYKGKPISAWQRAENQNLAINSAKGIGCVVVNVGPGDLMNGTPHIVLGIVWQVIKVGLLQDITLKKHPELVALLREGETLEELMKLPPEELLLRWFNYQLEQAGHERRVRNFSSDITDSECYTVVLKQIAPNKECDLSPLEEQDKHKRAEKMLEQAAKIGCRKFVKPRDVVKGNPKLNLAFVANMFNTHPALKPVEGDYAELLEFDSEGTREERAFRFWIQSLGLDCNNLFEDVKDGQMLLKVIEKIQPNIVDWKKVTTDPKRLNKFSKVGNCNYLIDLCKNKLKISTVNVSGVDIYEGNPKLVLGIVWQLMRAHILEILKKLGGGKPVDEDEILKWANSKVPGEKINSFKDPSLSSGVFLCKLCHSVSPKSCNMECVMKGETDEEKEQNAKYAISVARKIGCSVFLLWEDIVEVKPKMILTFIAALMEVQKRRESMKEDYPQ